MLELLRSRSVGVRAPWAAALVVTAASLALVGLSMAASLIAFGEDAGGAFLYGGSMTGLGLVFAGFATLVGQLMRRAATVTGAGILFLGFAYVTRAIGDVRENGVKWLSPLAWQQETRPFADDPRVWPLLLAFGVAALLVAAGLWLVDRRDLGAALFASRPGPARAGGALRSTAGLALRSHAGAGIAWIAGALTVGVVFGAFTDDIADAIAANPALDGMLGGSDDVNEAYVGFTLAMIVIMAIGSLGQSLSRIRAEESGGRLEPTLARSVSRFAWLSAHAAAAGGFAALTLLAGAAGLAVTVGDTVDGTLAAGFAYLPVVCVVLGAALVLFGIFPRSTGLVWALVGYIAFIAFLGGTLSLPDWAMNLSPLQAIGMLPADDVSAATEWILVGVGAALLAAGLIGFRLRDIPR